MTEERAPSSRASRNARPMRWLALFAMLLQVLLTADHLGATAATSVSSDVAAAGILSLCHGEAGDRSSPIDTVDDLCVLCASAAVTGSGPAPQGPVVVGPAVVAEARVSETVVAFLVSRPASRFGVVRGPPLSLRA